MIFMKIVSIKRKDKILDSFSTTWLHSNIVKHFIFPKSPMMPPIPN